MKNHFLFKTQQNSGNSYSKVSQDFWLTNSSKLQQLSSEFSPAEAKTVKKQTQQTNVKRLETREHMSPQHSSYELMQHILNGVNCDQKNCLLSTEQEEEQIGELLTNRYKIENYKLELKSKIRKGGSEASKDLKLLLVLLQQIGNTSIEVKYGQQGLSIGFNTKLISRQEESIERLHRENQRRKREIQQITKEYDRILFQFNEVIEKLVPKEEKLKHFY